MRRLLSRRHEERGAVLVMATAGVILAMLAGALAVDIGRRVQDKNFDQQVADLAAFDAARKLPVAADVMAAAKNSAKNNGFAGWNNAAFGQSGHDLNVCLGTWNGGFSPSANCQVGSAVRVQANSSFSTIFPFVSAGGVNGKAIAQIAGPPEAAFMVGSSLATLDTSRSAILDTVLQDMLNSSSAVSIGLVGYQGLASGNVTLGVLGEELADLGISFGTPQQLLDASLTLFQLYEATARALERGGDTANATIFDALKLQLGAVGPVKLGKFITLGPGSSSAFDAGISVFSLLMSSASVANGTNAVAIPLTGLALPLNLTSISLSAALIEGPKIGIGPVGTTRTNTQATITLTVAVNILGLATVTLPINVAGGVATATLNAISCPTSPGVNIGVTTSGITNSGTASVTLPLLGTTNLTISGSTGGIPNTPLSFAYPGGFGVDQAQHVGGTGLGNAPTVAPSGLVGDIVRLVLNTLYPLLNPLISPVLQALGIDVGAADVSALAIVPPPPACGPGYVGQPSLLQ